MIKNSLKTAGQVTTSVSATIFALNLLQEDVSGFKNTLMLSDFLKKYPFDNKSKFDDMTIVMDKFENPEVYFGKNKEDRASSKIAYYSINENGEISILLTGRGGIVQAVDNNGADIQAAVNYNNGSLWTGNEKFSKISKILYEAPFINLSPIPRLSNEDNLDVEDREKDEYVVMSGFAAQVSEDDLRAGVIDGKSFILTIDEALKRTDLVAKAKSALIYLKAIQKIVK